MPAVIKLRRLAGDLISIYLEHQSWKAREGFFTPSSFHAAGPSPLPARRDARGAGRSLRKLAGVKLSESEATAAWPHVLEHKWYLGERLGRDVGLRVAAVDYFENINPPRPTLRAGSRGLPPRLPMMMPFGQRS